MDKEVENENVISLQKRKEVEEKVRQREMRTLRNFEIVQDGKNEIRIPIEAWDIWNELKERLLFRRCRTTPFFVQEGGEIRFFRSAAQLLAFVDSHGMRVEWSDKGIGMVTKGEFLEFIGCVAEKYDQITALPHYPEIPGIFYSRKIAPEKNGTLDELVNMLNFATDDDRQKLKAMFMTPFWGGDGGQRPAFCIDGLENDSNGNRGIGKTSITDALALLCGDCIDVSNKTDGEDVKKRLLTSGDSRLIRMDNIKIPTLSNQVIESLITSNRVSGHKMYAGHESLFNWFTWVLTFNDTVLSKDMATRIVIIRLKRPEYAASWWRNVRGFIDKNRNRIIADIGWTLAQQAPQISKYTRFPQWDEEVMARAADNYDTVYASIMNERIAVDEDNHMAEEVEELIGSQISKFWIPETFTGERKYLDPEKHIVVLPRTWVYSLVMPLIGKNISRKYLAKKFDQWRPKQMMEKELKIRGDRYLIWEGMIKKNDAPGARNDAPRSGYLVKFSSGVPTIEAHYFRSIDFSCPMPPDVPHDVPHQEALNTN